jgi:hypothetical protein
MHKPIQILATERDGDDGLIVTFSDRTWAGYVAEELLQLTPRREQLETPEDSNRDTTGFPVHFPDVEVPGIA